jgi:hypothetical protein
VALAFLALEIASLGEYAMTRSKGMLSLYRERKQENIMKHYLSRRAVLPTIMLAVLVACAMPSRADQPKMQAALEALKLARRELAEASADKGGHRGKAIELVEQAIAQVEKGITFDRKN